MLRELPNVSQVNGEPKRRWFADEYFDLIVWSNEKEEVIEFHLHYDINRDERVFCWKYLNSFSHMKVDDGEKSGRLNKATPVFYNGGGIDTNKILTAFANSCSKLEYNISNLVLNKLNEYQHKLDGGEKR